MVVGASLAGLRAAAGLRRSGFDGDLVVVGAETHYPYDRPPLSKQLLTGKTDAAGVQLDRPDDLGIEWWLGTRATALDVAERRVQLEAATPGSPAGRADELAYDLLVIATGAAPRILPSFEPGPGVHYLRTIDDSLQIREALLAAEKMIVIGAGFIGLEVASSASSLGLDVTVLETLPVPLSRAVGDEMGNAVADFHRRHGVTVMTGVSVEGIVGTRSFEGVKLSGGGVIPGELVVVGVGVAPVTAWLESSGVDLHNGVLCDESLRVTRGGRPLPDVVAAGDVARWRHPAYGAPVRVEHWTNAVEQGEAAAKSLLMPDAAPAFGPVPYFWSDQHGAKIQFVGDATGWDDLAVVDGSIEEDRFVVAYGRQGNLAAALGMRRPAKVMAMQRLIEEGAGFPPPS